MQNRANTIWRKLFTTAIIIGAVLILAKTSNVRAQITPLLDFAGKVTNVDGSELADGTYNFNFALYTQPTGGAAIWTEDLSATTRFSGTIASAAVNADGVTYFYSGGGATTTFRLGQYLTNASTSETALVIDFASSSVTVASGSPLWITGQPINNRPFIEGGVVNINLGSVADLSGVDFNQTLYLEVVFNGETMQPRKIMTPATQAFQAGKLGDKTEAELAGLADSETITGEWSFNNIVSIATTSSLTALTVTQNGSGNIAEFKYGATTSLALLSDGRVQIGDYIFPASRAGSAAGYVLKIDGAGNMYWANDAAGSGGGSGLWASSTDGSYLFQSDTGVIVVLGNNATTTNLSGYHLQVTGGSWFETLALSSQNQLRLYDADSSNYIALRASSTLTSDYILTLPTGTGAPGQTLITDGSGILSWSTLTSSTVYVNPGTTGQFAYYAGDGSTLTATSSIYLNNFGNIGIGSTSPASILDVFGTVQLRGSESSTGLYISSAGYVGAGTTTPATLFHVDGTGTFEELCFDSDCITNWSGAGLQGSGSVAGQPAVWVNSNTLTATSAIETAYGGTSRSAWTQYAIPYLTDSATFGEIGIGTSTYLLAVNASGNGYQWVEASSTGVVLSQEQVDDYIDALINDPDSVHNRITITYDDVDNAMDFVVESDLSQYNNQTSQFFSTTTNILGLAYGGTNATNTADARTNLDLTNIYNYAINSQGSLGQIWVGTVGVRGQWQATNTLGFIPTSDIGINVQSWDNDLDDIAALTPGTDNFMIGNGINWLAVGSSTVYSTTLGLGTIALQDANSVNIVGGSISGITDLAVADGGTGFSAISNQSLVYASSDNVLSGFTIGNEGEVLAVVGGNLDWATTSAPSAHAILSVSHSDVDATSTLVRGDLMVVNSNTNWSRLGIGPNGYILYSDGTDINWSTTTAITALGSITIGAWLADTVDIAYGGTGTTTAPNYGNMLIGNASGGWDYVASSTLGGGSGGVNQSKFIGTTTETTNGEIATSTLRGYEAANYICNAEFSGSHFCRTYDILVSIEQDDISTWDGSAWIAEGPPGYTSNSNDCNGWIASSSIMLGAFWVFDDDGGGAGWLTNCSGEKSLACCQR